MARPRIHDSDTERVRAWRAEHAPPSKRLLADLAEQLHTAMLEAKARGCSERSLSYCADTTEHTLSALIQFYREA